MILRAKIRHLDKMEIAVYAIMILEMHKESIVVRHFNKGDRVVWTDTGREGTVRLQFTDGNVSLILDDGSPAELEAGSLQILRNRKVTAR